MNTLFSVVEIKSLFIKLFTSRDYTHVNKEVQYGMCLNPHPIWTSVWLSVYSWLLVWCHSCSLLLLN